jgi:hypothetical protein
MLGTTVLLKQKINSLPKSKRKDYLLKCIVKNNSLDLGEYQEEEFVKDIKVDHDSMCKLCNNYDFIKDKYTETCQNCGVERDLIPTGTKYEKIEYIKPGSNLVKIIKDSKKITVDLNKINLWLQDTDPLAKDTQKIIDNLSIVFQGRGLDLPRNVQNSSISLWYNFSSLFNNYNGPESLRKTYNKKAVLVLCVYYGALINNYTLSLEQLSLLFNINTKTIMDVNPLFKEVFKETEYYKYLILQKNTYCNIKLSPKNKILFEKIKGDLVKNVPGISETLSNKEFTGIVYFITNKINVAIKYTLKELEEKCNVSTTSISTMSKLIEKFYKNNKLLYKELI